MDIPAQGDDDRLENMHARFCLLPEEAQGFTEGEGGVKALEHLILFLLQMSSKVSGINSKPLEQLRTDHKSLPELL